MAQIKLTTPAFLVLGLVEQLQPATPYELKAMTEISVAKFWTLPHTQIYAQCDRLTEIGLLSEERETTGRRRRLLSLTPEGKAQLDAWRAEPAPEPVEIRSLATLKLFFGAEPTVLAAQQIEQHEAELAQLLALAELDGLTRGQQQALVLGIGQERAFVQAWRQLAGDAPA